MKKKSRNKKMKSKIPFLLCIIAIIIVLILILIGKGFGFGAGGAGTGNGTETGSDVKEVKHINENNQTPTHAIDNYEATEEVDKEKIIKVTVSEKDYFYNNERIKLDDLISHLQEISGQLVVEIVDDNATLRAYNKLISELETQNIRFIKR